MTAYGRDVVELYGASVLMPEYRLAPEHPFPVAPEDAWKMLGRLRSGVSRMWRS